MKNIFLTLFLFSFLQLQAQNTTPTKLSQYNNYFTWKAFKEVRKNTQKPNTFIATYSLYNLLMMLYLGAESKTATDLEKVLKLPQKQKDNVLPNFKVWTNQQKSQEPKFETQNFVWLQKGFSPRIEFVNDVRKYFSSELKVIDFTQKIKALEEINTFFAEKTAGKIKQVFKENDIQANTRLILNNYNNFVATWEVPFKPSANKIAGFQSHFTSYVETEFMEDTRRLRYSETRDLQMIELPYKTSNHSKEFVMQVILPKSEANYQFLLNKIQNSQYIYWESMMNYEEVFISLPKWEIKQDLDLEKTLSGLGLHDIFNPQKANFQNMKDSLYIGKILQSNYINVNENGTEAKAVSTAMGVLGNPQRNKPKYFVAIHPFLYLIKNKTDDTVLFIGVLEEVKGKKMIQPPKDDMNNILGENNTVPKAQLQKSNNPIKPSKTPTKPKPKTNLIKVTGNAQNYYQTGKTKRSQKDYTNALEDLKQAIQLAPDFGQAYAEMGYTYANLKQYYNALQAYNIALQLGYEDKILYLNRGWAKYNLDKKSDYCNDWKKSIELGYPKAQKAMDAKCK